jgi:hypothetical protein
MVNGLAEEFWNQRLPNIACFVVEIQVVLSRESVEIAGHGCCQLTVVVATHQRMEEIPETGKSPLNSPAEAADAGGGWRKTTQSRPS